MATCVEVRRLTFAYPSGPMVLADVSFSLDERETICIVGPNGAGKSTLLLHLNGILPDPVPPDDSARGVWIDGMKVRPSKLPEIRQRIGLVFQDPDDQLFCPTLLEDVLFGPLHLGLPVEAARRRAMESLHAVGLVGLESRPPSQLSVGEQKRACLAGVLACGPKILILDEPTSHLDPRGRREWIELLSSLQCPKIIATHDLELAVDMASRVMILDQGRVFADGPTIEVLSDAELMHRHGLEVPRSLRLETDSHPSSLP